MDCIAPQHTRRVPTSQVFAFACYRGRLRWHTWGKCAPRPRLSPLGGQLMSARSRFTGHLILTIAIGLALGRGAMAQGSGPGGKDAPKGSPPLPEPAKKVTLTRLFTPKHTDPAEVLDA